MVVVVVGGSWAALVAGVRTTGEMRIKVPVSKVRLNRMGRIAAESTQTSGLLDRPTGASAHIELWMFRTIGA